MNNSSSQLIDFVLEELAGKPLAVRVRLYRAVADLETNENIAAALVELANELEGCDAKSDAIQLELRLLHQREKLERHGISHPEPMEAGR